MCPHASGACPRMFLFWHRGHGRGVRHALDEHPRGPVDLPSQSFPHDTIQAATDSERMAAHCVRCGIPSVGTAPDEEASSPGKARFTCHSPNRTVKGAESTTNSLERMLCRTTNGKTNQKRPMYTLTLVSPYHGSRLVSLRLPTGPHHSMASIVYHNCRSSPSPEERPTHQSPSSPPTTAACAALLPW